MLGEVNICKDSENERGRLGVLSATMGPSCIRKNVHLEAFTIKRNNIKLKW